MLFDYTAELRYFFEQDFSQPPLSHKQKIELGRRKLFDFEYPIFDELYRPIFETHFIRKFYMREIGFETFGLFKFQLETWLIINMSYFNKLFESELLQYDPLTNSSMDVSSKKKTDKTKNDIRETFDLKSINGQTTGTANRTGTTENTQTSSITGVSSGSNTKHEEGSSTDDDFNRQLESNNPDSRLTITTNDGQGVIEYASSIKENNTNNAKNTQVDGTNTSEESTQVDSNASTTGGSTDLLIDNTSSTITQNDKKDDNLSSVANDLENYVQNRVGKIGVQSYAKLVQEYRSSLLRVENMIFNEMNELFMLVY